MYGFNGFRMCDAKFIVMFQYLNGKIQYLERKPLVEELSNL